METEMNRDELLDKLAMKLTGWPASAGQAAALLPSECGMRFPGRLVTCPKIGVVAEKWNLISEMEWRKRRTELINCPPDSEAPDGARWKCQDANGGWSFWYNKPDIFEDDDEDESGWCGDVGSPCAEYNTEHEEKLRGVIPNGHRWQDTLTEVKTMTTTAHEDQYDSDVSDPEEDKRWDEHKAQLDRAKAEKVKEWRGPEDGLKEGEKYEYSFTMFQEDKSTDMRDTVTFIGTDGLRAVIKTSSGKYVATNPLALRPIRTDRECWIEAAHDAYTEKPGSMEERFGRIYDVGLARTPGANYETP